MPFLHHNSSIRARKANAALRLDVCHSLLVGEQSDARTTQQYRASYDLKKSLPPSVDVFSHSDLTFIISGIVNGRRLTSESVKRSIMTRHFVQMLRENIAVLGINNVSNAYIDEFDSHVKVNVTPERSVPAENPGSQIALVSIHLTYHCKTIKNDIDNRSVSLESSLNSELLNQAVDRLITYHIAKRYPLIFGSWGEKLEQEKLYFPSIARSLFSMARRSPNNEFRRQVKRYLKILRKRVGIFELDAINDLEKCCSQLLDYGALSNEEPSNRRSDEGVICSSMQQLFKLALRPSLIRCKHVAEDTIAVPSNDDSIELLLCKGPGSDRADLLSVLNDDDDVFDAIQGDNDLIYNSESEDSTASRSETNWTFMSRPPLRAEAMINSPYETQSSGDGSEDKFLEVHGTNVFAKESQTSFFDLDQSEDTSQDASSGSFMKQHTQSYSDFSDSDSDCLSLSFMEESYSPTPCSADDTSDSNTTNTNISNSGHKPYVHKTLTSATQMDQDGHKETSFTHFVSADRSCLLALSSTASIAPQLPLRCFSDADQELIFECNVSLPPVRSSIDEDFSSFAPLPSIDRALHASATNLSYSSLLSDSVPMVGLPPPSISLGDDKDANTRSLGRADEAGVGFDLCSIWGAKTGEGPSLSSPLHSQGLPLSSDVTRCSTYLEKAVKSGGQMDSQEGRAARTEYGSPELCYGVFDFADHVGSESCLSDDGDLGIDSDDNFDNFASSRMLQDDSSGRLGEEVEMEMILDSGDEEEGESRWSLFA